MKQVARELGVRYVLEGSVRKAGNRVRITGQLIDTGTGAHIWADRFDGALDDIFELQDQVASGVVGAIEPRLRSAEIERAIRKPTDSLDAYDLYLRALALRDKHTDESVREAISLLKQALAIDPDYAPAKAAIGWSCIRQRSHGRTPVLEADAAEAVAFARMTLEVGKADPDTLWMAAATLAIFGGGPCRRRGSNRPGADSQSQFRPCLDGTRLGVRRGRPTRRGDRSVRTRCDRARWIAFVEPSPSGSPAPIWWQAGTKRRWTGRTGPCAKNLGIGLLSSPRRSYALISIGSRTRARR